MSPFPCEEYLLHSESRKHLVEFRVELLRQQAHCFVNIEKAFLELRLGKVKISHLGSRHILILFLLIIVVFRIIIPGVCELLLVALTLIGSRRGGHTTQGGRDA